MKNFKTPFLSALVFFGTLFVLSVGYAAWTSLVPSDADGGKPLTSTLLKGMINSINDIGTRTDGIYSSAGNVGIGTVSPTGALLHINDANGTIGLLKLSGKTSGVMSYTIQNSAGINNWQINAGTDGYSIIDGTQSSYRMIINNSGNVGIGTASPNAKLQVVGDTVSSRFYSISVTTASTPSGVPVTIYDATGKNGLYLVSVDNYGDPVHYGAFAVVTVGSTGAKVLYNVGNVYMPGITVSGMMIQATQGSGGATTITATLTKLQ